jgi:thiol-disulfide isomerase/thioredoxin
MSYATFSSYNTSLSEEKSVKSNGFQRSNPGMNQGTFESAELLYPTSPVPVQETVPQKENYASGLTELTETTISTLSKPTLVLFYAPWCSHCTHFRPIYEEAAVLAKQSEVSVEFALLNGAVFTKPIETYQIKGFPTVVLMNNGKQVVFNGKRVSSDIVAWVKENL